MSRSAEVRLALAQLDAVVGDLAGNRTLIVDAIREAHAAGADLVVFPELAVTGYPPEDLLLRPGFIRAARASLDEIAAARDAATVIGMHFIAEVEAHDRGHRLPLVSDHGNLAILAKRLL